MSTRRAKKLAVTSFVAGLCALAMASAAFACTALAGKSTMAGINGTKINGTTGGSVTYYGNGGDFGSPVAAQKDGYCTAPSRIDVDTGAVPAATPHHFSLTVASHTCPTGSGGQLGATKADSGEYEVRWVKAEPAIDSSFPYPACHRDIDHNTTTTDNPTSRWVVLGTMTINSSGNGTGDYALPAAMYGPGNICLERSQVLASGGAANTPPIIFIDKVNLI